jgi:pimeloyl-ACP methyl ester carboxylesterase
VLTEGLRNFDASEKLKSIELPTLVLVGEQDRVIPAQHRRDLAEGIRGAQLAEIGRVGHLSYMEKPEAFNKTVLDFLARH